MLFIASKIHYPLGSYIPHRFFTTLLVLIFFGNGPLHSQQSLFVNASGGFMVPHRDEIRGLVTAHSTGFEVGAMWNTDGSKTWHQRYHNPLWGLEGYFSDLGNEALGKQGALSIFTRLPSFRRPQFSAYWHFGIGAGYSNARWDIDTNTKGIVLGSHFNAALGLGYYTELCVSEKLSLTAGIRMTHLSNGSVVVPNLGTNNAAFSLGCRYSMKDEFVSNTISNIPAVRGMQINAGYAAGLRQNQPAGGPNHFVHTLSIGSAYRFNYSSSLLFGLDVFYNTSIRPFLIRDNGGYTSADLIQTGAFLGYAKHFDRMEFRIQAGYYLMNKYGGNGSLYHRFGFRYRITDHLMAQFHLKTHFAKADYPEIGIVWYRGR
jgi:hypothetical protein